MVNLILKKCFLVVRAKINLALSHVLRAKINSKKSISINFLCCFGRYGVKEKKK